MIRIAHNFVTLVDKSIGEFRLAVDKMIDMKELIFPRIDNPKGDCSAILLQHVEIKVRRRRRGGTYPLASYWLPY